MSPTREKKGGGKADVVRFNIYLPREAYDALEKLRESTGKSSLAETIRCALKLYVIVQDEIEDGKEILLRDRDKGDIEKLRLVSL